jgi:6-phosphogluconolactonase/glucosamine-6-phosphate isomerase/deaminase
MLQFVRSDALVGLQSLYERINTELRRGKRVVWLLSGGSNIPLAVAAMQQIQEELTPKLTIIPMDERYGPVGHTDSNIRQLFDAGFDPKQAMFIPVLRGVPLTDTINLFARHLRQPLDHRNKYPESNIIIGQFGVGPDGHTAGILPHSPAAEETTALAVGYQASDFMRITLTFSVLRQVDVAFGFAYGPVKRAALQQLRDSNLLLVDQPAQILKVIPEACVYNDQLEEEGV